MTIKPINNTDEFYQRLAKEGKVIILNRPEDFERQKRMNEIIKEELSYIRRTPKVVEAIRNCHLGPSSIYNIY